MFQDVHQGGPAYSAGIRPGDLLLGNGEREIRPPEDLTFSVGESASLVIEKLHGGQQTVKVQLPIPKSKTHPVTAPKAVHAERLSYEIGLLKVAMFPGVIADMGAACAALHNRVVRGVKAARVQCDEIWSFSYAKEKNVPKQRKERALAASGRGSLLTLIASWSFPICAVAEMRLGLASSWRI